MMAAIVISDSDSERDVDLKEGSDSDDSEFERDLREATRQSLALEVSRDSHSLVPPPSRNVSNDAIVVEGDSDSCDSPVRKPSNVSNDAIVVKGDSDSERSKDGCTNFLHGDESLPIYDAHSSGCTYSEAVRILLNPDKSRLCTKQPILVEQNCTLAVNLNSLEDPDDIKSDDCGHWVHNGRKSTRVAVWFRSGDVLCVKSTTKSTPPDENSKLFTLVRTYYTHDPHEDFRRIFYHLFDSSKVRHDLCLVQYHFDGEPHEVRPRPHGNSKVERPYARSTKSLQEKLKQSGGIATPKDALANTLEQCGGLLEARSAGCIPKSRSQVRYHQSRSKQKLQAPSKSDALFSVMLQCKSTDPDSDEAFVRSVVAAPEPMAVLCTNQQLNDMVRFLTDPAQHTVMGVDPTFNFGDFNVTPVAFRYQLLEHRNEGHSPVLLGPLLVHQQKKFSSYHFFASTLVSLCPALRNIRAFGTDGERELYKAFKMQLPNAIHLRCFRHFRANLTDKLRKLCIPPSDTKEFLNDVFGRSIGEVHEAGLVDAASTEEFDAKLEAYREVWEKRESAVHPSRSPTFFEWFVREKASDIKESMLLPVREAAGLGSPPSPFYTNICECLNSILHEKVHYKASEWHKFNEAMRELVKQSYQMVELSVIDHGTFCFRPQYQHLVVSQDRWFRMTSKQRQNHLAKVVSTPLSESLVSEIPASTYSLCSSSEGLQDADLPVLDVSAEAADIQTLPIAVIQGIWQKAAELLSKPGLVMDAPTASSSHSQCFVVASKSLQRPRIVQQGQSAHFSCEPSCPMWQSSRICSHSVAAAQFSGQLREFIVWYKKSKGQPNLDKLAKLGMPKGSGRKGEKPPRKRKKTASSAPLSLVERNVPSTSTEQQTAQGASRLPPQTTAQRASRLSPQQTVQRAPRLPPQTTTQRASRLPPQMTAQRASRLPPQTTAQRASRFPSPLASPSCVSPSANTGQHVQWSASAQPFSITSTTTFPQSSWVSTQVPSQPPSWPEPPFDTYQPFRSSLLTEETFHPYTAPYSPYNWPCPWQMPFPSSPFPPSPFLPSPFPPSPLPPSPFPPSQVQQPLGRPSPRPSAVSTHPFFLRVISGNIRVCRGSLRALDGSIPPPPLDVAVARLEQRPFWDKATGTWCTPQKETHAHYHLRLSCILSVEPSFVPNTLVIPPELQLGHAHRDLLQQEFGID